MFWKRADLRWHTYEPVPEVAAIEKFLAVVQEGKLQGSDVLRDPCPSCGEMQAERPIRSREDLRALSDVLAAEIAADRIAEENLEQFAEYYPTPFADVREGKLEDIVFCLFHCTRCEQKYSLTCETYHGRGGRWAPFEPCKTK